HAIVFPRAIEATASQRRPTFFNRQGATEFTRQKEVTSALGGISWNMAVPAAIKRAQIECCGVISRSRSVPEQLQPLIDVSLDTLAAKIHRRHSNGGRNATFPKQFGIYRSSHLKLAATISVCRILASPDM